MELTKETKKNSSNCWATAPAGYGALRFDGKSKLVYLSRHLEDGGAEFFPIFGPKWDTLKRTPPQRAQGVFLPLTCCDSANFASFVDVPSKMAAQCGSFSAEFFLFLPGPKFWLRPKENSGQSRGCRKWERIELTRTLISFFKYLKKIAIFDKCQNAMFFYNYQCAKNFLLHFLFLRCTFEKVSKNVLFAFKKVTRWMSKQFE